LQIVLITENDQKNENKVKDKEEVNKVPQKENKVLTLEEEAELKE